MIGHAYANKDFAEALWVSRSRLAQLQGVVLRHYGGVAEERPRCKLKFALRYNRTDGKADIDFEIQKESAGDGPMGDPAQTLKSLSTRTSAPGGGNVHGTSLGNVRPHLKAALSPDPPRETINSVGHGLDAAVLPRGPSCIHAVLADA